MITLISILADIDDQLNHGDNILSRIKTSSNNPYRVGSSVEEYLHNLNIYAQVMKIYVCFFSDYWYKDNVEKTNEMMKERLKKAGIIGWSGLTAEENNPLGEYALSLDLPIKDSDMKNFFNRVRSGDLAFLCRYPYNGTDAFELLKGVV